VVARALQYIFDLVLNGTKLNPCTKPVIWDVCYDGSQGLFGVHL
jgi:hypothetical protein